MMKYPKRESGKTWLLKNFRSLDVSLMSFERSDVIYMFFSLLTLAPNRKIRVTCCCPFDCHVTFFLTGEIRSVLVEAAAGLSGRTGSLFFVSLNSFGCPFTSFSKN